MSTASQSFLKLKASMQSDLDAREDREVALNRIKIIFKTDIGSPRRFERIKSLSELIEILERRNCVSENRLDSLEKIVEELGNPQNVCRLARDYKNLLAFGIDTSRKHKLYSALVQGLGRHHRDFARYLGIEESQLETVDIAHPTDLASRIWKLLDICEKKFDNFGEYFENICTALQKCRRKDLIDKIILIKESNSV